MDVSALITQCKQAMEDKRMTNRDVARLADISESTVSRMLASDGRNVGATTLEAICQALQVDEDPGAEQTETAAAESPSEPAADSDVAESAGTVEYIPVGVSSEDMERIYERRVEDLRQQVDSKEHWLRVTVFICICLIGAILLILIVDFLSPSIGWFRRSAPAGYLANTASGIYHRADCVAAASVSDAHRLGFSSAQAAVDAGYRACQICLR